MDGRKQGEWTFRDAGGTVTDGTFVDGKTHGRWIYRFPEGGSSEGPYVDDAASPPMIRKSSAKSRLTRSCGTSPTISMEIRERIRRSQ